MNNSVEKEIFLDDSLGGDPTREEEDKILEELRIKFGGKIEVSLDSSVLRINTDDFILIYHQPKNGVKVLMNGNKYGYLPSLEKIEDEILDGKRSLEEQENFLKINGAFVVVWDIHGHYEIFEETPYNFSSRAVVDRLYTLEEAKSLAETMNKELKTKKLEKEIVQTHKHKENMDRLIEDFIKREGIYVVEWDGIKDDFRLCIDLHPSSRKYCYPLKRFLKHTEALEFISQKRKEKPHR